MIYLNVELPFNIENLFLWFNPSRIPYEPKIIEYYIGDIDGQEAPAGFHNRGKNTVFLVNNDLMIVCCVFL
jgi:hypothetical protein